MGVRINQVRQAIGVELLPVHIPVGDEQLHLLIRPDFLSGQVEKDLAAITADEQAEQKAKDAGKPHVAKIQRNTLYGRVVLALVAQWDLEDDAGVVYPLTPDGVARVPALTVQWLLLSVMTEVQKLAAQKLAERGQ